MLFCIMYIYSSDHINYNQVRSSGLLSLTQDPLIDSTETELHVYMLSWVGLGIMRDGESFHEKGKL